jgi:hypothetical protein
MPTEPSRVDLGPEALTVDCIDCEGDHGGAGHVESCPKSKKICGHHCNHSWSHEHCHYCGKEWGAE